MTQRAARRWAVSLLLLPCAAAAALDTSRDRQAAGGAALHWVPCRFEPPFGRVAHCAEFHPTTPSGPQAAPVDIPVVVVEPDGPAPRDSPVLYLPAGPGDATGLDRAGMARWWNWTEQARWAQPLVLMDARGAGLATPSLACPEVIDADRRHLAQVLDAVADLQLLRTAARRCYRRLGAAGIDPARFNAAAQMRDAAELMDLLDPAPWNLWGVSYGTRLALQLARSRPQRVRALLLDSSYPPEVNGLLELPHQLAAALDGLPAQCAADPACAAEHPLLRAQLHALLRHLAHHPVRLDLEKWPAQWRYRLAVNDYRLAWMLFLESYRSPFHPRFPHAVAAAAAGDYEPLHPLAEGFIDDLLDADFSYGLYFSTICPEDLPGTGRAAYLEQVRRHPLVAAYVAAQWDEHVCHDWQAGRLPPEFAEPLRSEAPALFLNGAEDYTTLTQWSARASAHLPNSRHFVFRGSSHAVTMHNACAMALADEFLAEPENPRLPACLKEAVEAPP